MAFEGYKNTGFTRGMPAGRSGARRVTRRWYLDPTAIAVALVINGYAMSGIVATYLGLPDADQRLSYIVRILTFLVSGLAFATSFRGRVLSKLNGILFAFWLVYLARLLWDVADPFIEGTEIALVFFLGACTVPAALIASSHRDWDEQNVARALVLSGLLVCIGGLLLRDIALQSQMQDSGRLSFSKLNPISLGHVGCTTVLASISIMARRRGAWWWIALVATSIAMILMTYAASRGALVALAICLFAYVVARRAWGYVAAGAIVIYILVASYGVMNPDKLLEFTGLSQLGSDTSSMERIELMSMAMDQIRGNWQFGSSYTLPMQQGYPHNIILEAFMATGIIGVSIFLYSVLRGAFLTMKCLAGAKPLAALMFIQYFWGAQFSGALWASAGFWLALTVVLAKGFAPSKATRATQAERVPKTPPSRAPPQILAPGPLDGRAA
ncbi:MAG: O-antigen ligase family protein [Candidatus Nanopelagicales bacterium]